MNRSFGGSLDCNSVNYNKGKSFRFSEWNSSTLYSNDDYIQDFVSYMGSMYACIQTNTAVEPTNEFYWKLVVSGQPGIQGKQGKTGVTFTPHVDSEGNLSWTNDGGLENPVTVNIKGQKGDTGKDSTVPGPKGDSITGPVGPPGKKGEQGIGLEFNWDGTKLGIKRTVDEEYTYVDLKGTTGSRGLRGLTGNTGPEGPQGPKGDSLCIRVDEPNEFGQIFLQKRYNENEDWVSFFDLSRMRGPKGDSIIVERNTETGNIEYRYQNQPSTANKVLIKKDDIKGPKGDTIARTYVADDGYLYIQLSGEDLPRRVGYVRGDRGADGREIVLRTYTGPSENPDDPRLGTHIQWKYAGDEYKLWTNLIQINELMNVALAGIKLEYEVIQELNEIGVMTKYEVLHLSSYEVEFDEDNKLVLTKKIANLSTIKVPTKTWLKDVKYNNTNHSLIFTLDTATGDQIITVSLDELIKEFDDKIIALETKHDQDIETLDNKIIKVEEDLTTEVSERQEADTQLQTNIDNETQRATQAETQLQENINTLESKHDQDIETINQTIETERQAREDADVQLQNNLDNLEEKHDTEVKTINNSLTRMYPKVFPLSVTVSGGGLYKLGTTQNPTISWVTKEATDVITPKTVSINDEDLDPSVTSKAYSNISTNTTYTVKVSNGYETVNGSTTLRFVNPNYFGTVDATSEVTAEIILAFAELIRGSKSYTGTTSLNNQRTVYAYPKSFGALTSIKDANNFDYLNSYTRSELEINEETYYVYVLTSPTSITTFKQIYA